MSTPDEWARAYARQADADFKTWDVLRQDSTVPLCHALLFLKMACEKLCKAHLIRTGGDPERFQASHAYVANPLPVIIKQRLLTRRNKKGLTDFLKHVRHLAFEIEMLAPAVRRGGKRPDNCEYPWDDDGGVLHSPLDWTFAATGLLATRNGRRFLEILRESIDTML
jgi:hypothetical protein